MSQIARVFVVLNLLLAAGFLFAAGTFLGTKADFIDQLNAEKAGRKADNDKSSQDIAKLKANIEELTTANNALKEAKTKEETSAQERKGRVEALEAEAAKKDSQIKGLTDDIASAQDAIKRGQDEIKRLGDSNTDLVGKVAAAQKAEQEAKAAETAAKATIVEKDNAIAGLEKDKKTLDDLNHEKALMLEWARTQGIDFAKAVKMEPVEARVLAYDAGLKLVQFNVGEKAKVARGYYIDVVRGNTYIGRVRIDQVYADNCAGTLMYAQEGQAPSVGDRGTNTL